MVGSLNGTPGQEVFASGKVTLLLYRELKCLWEACQLFCIILHINRWQSVCRSEFCFFQTLTKAPSSCHGAGTTLVRQGFFFFFCERI